MSFLGKLITFTLPPGLPLVQSFKEQSSPDHTWTMAGIQIGSHSDHGLPSYFPNYLTFSSVGQPPVTPPSVPEPSISSMMLMALGVALCIWVLRGRKG